MMSGGNKMKIYGQPFSRAQRPVWMAYELGLDFDQINVPYNDPAVFALNPNGKVPLLVDTDGVTVFESIAICQYLVRRYGKGNDIAPKNYHEEAALLQWGMWSMTELEPIIFERNICAMPEEAHAFASKEAFEAIWGYPKTEGRTVWLNNRLEIPLGVLEGSLVKSLFLAGDRFTAADLVVSSIMGWVGVARRKDAVKKYPSILRWLKACFTRPHCPFNPVQRPDWMAYPTDLTDDNLTAFPAGGVFNVEGIKKKYGNAKL